MRNLTKTLILHPIGTLHDPLIPWSNSSNFHVSPPAAGLAGLAFLFGLCGASYHRVGTILMTLLSGLATLATLLAFIIDMVLFGITRNRIRRDGTPAQYGNANWLVLGALVALMLGFCASTCGVFGRYRRRKDAY